MRFHEKRFEITLKSKYLFGLNTSCIVLKKIIIAWSVHQNHFGISSDRADFLIACQNVYTWWWWWWWQHAMIAWISQDLWKASLILHRYFDLQHLLQQLIIPYSSTILIPCLDNFRGDFQCLNRKIRKMNVNWFN
jgi:hypothetical protein